MSVVVNWEKEGDLYIIRADAFLDIQEVFSFLTKKIGDAVEGNFSRQIVAGKYTLSIKQGKFSAIKNRLETSSDDPKISQLFQLAHPLSDVDQLMLLKKPSWFLRNDAKYGTGLMSREAADNLARILNSILAVTDFKIHESTVDKGFFRVLISRDFMRGNTWMAPHIAAYLPSMQSAPVDGAGAGAGAGSGSAATATVPAPLPAALPVAPPKAGAGLASVASVSDKKVTRTERHESFIKVVMDAVNAAIASGNGVAKCSYKLEGRSWTMLNIMECISMINDTLARVNQKIRIFCDGKGNAEINILNIR